MTNFVRTFRNFSLALLLVGFFSTSFAQTLLVTPSGTEEIELDFDLGDLANVHYMQLTYSYSGFSISEIAQELELEGFNANANLTFDDNVKEITLVLNPSSATPISGEDCRVHGDGAIVVLEIINRMGAMTASLKDTKVFYRTSLELSSTALTVGSSLTIHADDRIKEATIVSMSGEVMKHQEVEGFEADIVTTGLAKGLYLVKGIDMNGNAMIPKKLLIQ